MTIKTVIKENDWLFKHIPEPHRKIFMKMMEVGWGNGYVLIPIGHPLHGKNYEEIDEFVSVHGGLTFSNLIDADLIRHFNLEEEDIGKWCVGFDTCHFEDNIQRWPKEFVQAEADRLARQLENYAFNNKID